MRHRSAPGERHSYAATHTAASRGARPSRRSAVHARRGNPSSGKRRGAAPPRPMLMAMKRAMRKVALRDCGQRCVYCASPLDLHTATLDHVHPLSLGGAHESENIVVACAPCNRLKSDMPPQEFFARHPWAGQHFVQYARSVHRALKRMARRAVSLACAHDARERIRMQDRLAA